MIQLYGKSLVDFEQRLQLADYPLVVGSTLWQRCYMASLPFLWSKRPPVKQSFKQFRINLGEKGVPVCKIL